MRIGRHSRTPLRASGLAVLVCVRASKRRNSSASRSPPSDASEPQHARAVEQELTERFRARLDRDAARTIEIDFPKRLPPRSAKQQVTDELDRIDPRWRRLFVLYATGVLASAARRVSGDGSF